PRRRSAVDRHNTTNSCGWSWRRASMATCTSSRVRRTAAQEPRPCAKRSNGDASPQEGSTFQPDGGASEDDAAESGDIVVPARPGRDDDGEGEGAAAVRGAVDHAGEARRSARTPAGRTLHP